MICRRVLFVGLAVVLLGARRQEPATMMKALPYS